jgi:hypothetical protein
MSSSSVAAAKNAASAKGKGKKAETTTDPEDGLVSGYTCSPRRESSLNTHQSEEAAPKPAGIQHGLRDVDAPVVELLVYRVKP